jgi:tetratricopeptide (TPR) repeat protein
MIADDVVALSHYFEGNFQTLKEDIGVTEYKYGRVQAYVWAGTLLTAVNRWNDGRRLMKHGLDLAQENGDFTTAARTARNLGVGHAIAGELETGERFVRQSVQLLQRRVPLRIRLIECMRALSFKLVNMPYERTESLATLGSLLHYSGNFQAAEASFHNAEMHQARAIKFTTLRGFAGFRQVEMMLDQRKFDEADRLIEQALRDPGEPPGWGEKKIVEALFHLAFVRTRIRRADVCGDRRDWETHGKTATLYAEDFAHFGQELRLDWLIPLFRIALSGIERLSDRPGAAVLPIAEAQQRVAQFSNRLFETDVHMEQARVDLAMDNRESAREHVRQAQELSRKIGYRCKVSEIELITQLCT